MTNTVLSNGEMAPFAKIFDTRHGQLLAFIDFSDEEDELRIRLIGAPVNGVTPSANLGYDDEAARQRGFDKLDQAGAEDMALRFHNLVADLAA